MRACFKNIIIIIVHECKNFNGSNKLHKTIIYVLPGKIVQTNVLGVHA